MSTYCINCKHFVLSEGAPNKPELGRCAYKWDISMVTGFLVPIDSLPFAGVVRKDKNTCGEHAGLYKEKETTNV